MKIFFQLLFPFLTVISYGQAPILNQRDSSGKKHGKWIVYLDYKLKWLKGSTKRAAYSRYAYYDHGFNIYAMSGVARNWKMVSKGTASSEGKVKLLDGEYKWMDKKGTVRSIQVYEKGMPVSIKFFNAAGKTTEDIDYTKKWPGQPRSYQYIEVKKGKANCYEVRKIKHWGAWGSDTSAHFDVDTLKVVGDSTFTTVSYYIHGELHYKCDRIFVRMMEGNQEAIEQKIIEHGHCTEWYLNGQKHGEGEFYYGKGSWKMWDQSGKEIQPRAK